MDSPCVPCVFLPFISIPSATALFSVLRLQLLPLTIQHDCGTLALGNAWCPFLGTKIRLGGSGFVWSCISAKLSTTYYCFWPIKMAIFWASDILSQVMCVAFSPDGELLATASTVSQRRSRYFLFFHCLNTLKPNIWKKTMNNWNRKAMNNWWSKPLGSKKYKASDWFQRLQQLLILLLMPILASCGYLQLSNFRTKLPNCGTVRVGSAWQPVSPPKCLPSLAGVHRVTSGIVVWLFQIFCLTSNEPDYPLMWPYLDFDLLRWVTLVQFTVRSFRQMVLTWTQHGGAWPRDEPKTWTNQFQIHFFVPCH